MKSRPDFLDSPFFVGEVDNWHLKDGAPEEVRKEFEEYMLSKDLVSPSEDDEDD